MGDKAGEANTMGEGERERERSSSGEKIREGKHPDRREMWTGVIRDRGDYSCFKRGGKKNLTVCL